MNLKVQLCLVYEDKQSITFFQLLLFLPEQRTVMKEIKEPPERKQAEEFKTIFLCYV